MRKWYKLKPNLVRNDKVLFEEFRNDYLLTFGSKVNKNCNVCWLDYFYKMVKFQTDKPMEKTTEYVLKKKYNGIQFSRKGKETIIINQGNLTDSIAKMLIKEHPAGEKLFDKIPVKVEKPDKKIVKRKVKDAKTEG